MSHKKSRLREPQSYLKVDKKDLLLVLKLAGESRNYTEKEYLAFGRLYWTANG